MARHCFPTKKVLQQFQGGEQFAVERSGFEVEMTFNKPECFEPQLIVCVSIFAGLGDTVPGGHGVHPHIKLTHHDCTSESESALHYFTLIHLAVSAIGLSVPF